MNSTFASKTREQVLAAARRAGQKAREQVRGKNRLAMLREQAEGKEEPAKVYKECQCVWRQTELGPRFATQPDCVRHRQFKENPSFKQHPERAATNGRRKKVQSGD